VQGGMLVMAARRLEAHNQRNFECCADDAATLPFKDRTFDVALMVAFPGKGTDRCGALREVDVYSSRVADCR
jgi:ubiquinone/menaquinone biosynthesis C-methylase UbiE